MLLTDDKEAADKVRKWSTQSRENAPWYQHEEIGYNYRMSNVISTQVSIGKGSNSLKGAALGNSVMKRLWQKPPLKLVLRRFTRSRLLLLQKWKNS